MTLPASLLRELLNPNLSVGGRAELCCELAKQFENKGEYEGAREVLAGLWPRLGERPKLTDLDQRSAGEVLLRAGVLTGFIGSSYGISDAQEKAKDLIGESLAIFESCRYKKKIAEAQTELALCYWRKGEYNEACDLLGLALKQLTTDSELKAKVILRSAIVEQHACRKTEALRLLTDHTALFQKINNQTIKGCYHQTLADVLENLWDSEGPKNYLDRALVEYAAASYHFEQAGHRCYLANVENNLGFLLYKVNHCQEAHQHLDHARRIFTSLKDRNAAAQVDETRARVFLKEKRNAEAEKVARASVRTLENSDRQSLLAEALITHGIASARLGNYSTAFATLRRALELSQNMGDLNRTTEVTVTIFREMGDRLVVVEGVKASSGRKLSEQVRSLEHELIKQALAEADGSVTYAARALGMTYQALTYMLKTRHKDLLPERRPVRRRPRNR
ncbi:MAG TPA: helix-turn-helix domain-containing protein [Pyrinomonadaceae bacterium]|nr:helix-turn-helix domain-containing protein [Pyrinomonadaceae bacterium]